MTQSSQPDVSVVIVSYNTRDLLAQCLRSIFSQTPSLKLEVIVIDNASSDDSCGLVREQFRKVQLITNEENGGFAKATNQGIRASSGRYILLLNPDTIVLDQAIEKMVRFMEAKPRAGACGCKLVFPNGDFQPSAFPFPSLLGGLFEYSGLFERLPLLGQWLAPDWLASRIVQTRPVAWCSGACLLVSRACINDIGLLDESFYLYAEEVDWCQRMWRANWQVFYLIDAAVVHYLGASQDDDSGQLRRRLREVRSVLHYLRKWRGPHYTRAYQIILSICGSYRYLYCRFQPRRAADRTSALSQKLAYLQAIITARY